MLKPQFFDILKAPGLLTSTQLDQLALIVEEYPFFESAHLIYVKGLHQHNGLHYPAQLRKCAVVANNRTLLYELLHPKEIKQAFLQASKPETHKESLQVIEETKPLPVENQTKLNPVTISNTDIKVVYINTLSKLNNTPIETVTVKEALKKEIEIVQHIENETEASITEFDENSLNKSIENEINRGIIQSYVETDIIKTPTLHTVEVKEPGTFTEWLKAMQKEVHTFQIEPQKEKPDDKKEQFIPKSNFFNQKKKLIDKIIESDPGRIKFGSNKFFTPATDAKQSLLENEHLVTETLAKIYALQGNISKAIRAYEILSLKFPQKSVYFASLIGKLKTNK